MEKINILFLNLACGSDEYKNDRHLTLTHFSQSNSAALAIVDSISEAKFRLYNTDSSISEPTCRYDLLMIWVDDESCDAWKDLIDFKDECRDLAHLGFLVIFGFSNGHQIRDKARDAMLRDVYAFACPFNTCVLEAYIESIYLEAKDIKFLDDLKGYLLEAKDFHEMVETAFLELETHPTIDFDRVTISLVDNENKERYLLDSRPQKFNPDRELLKPITQDKLIQSVENKGVLVIGRLSHLRHEMPEVLEELGWEDSGSTADVSSWIGLAAKHQNQCVAIITFDHKTPSYYESYSERHLQFLRGFGDILADAIKSFFLERNARITKRIFHDIANAMESEELVRRLLINLREGLSCDNCTYFKVQTPADETEMFVEEWISVNNTSMDDHKTHSKKRFFEKGSGIVGNVLADGKSRIIANALESQEFEPTYHLSGKDLSMLAVPVVPYFSEDVSQANQIIGVINCYRNSKNHFTIYDRDLVEGISQNTATIIERTMTLEYANDISDKMKDLVLNKEQKKLAQGKEALLKKICEYALKITSARAAVIHLLRYVETIDGVEKYEHVDKIYAFPENLEQPEEPRLDGQGTTDRVIATKQTIEFSARDDNYKFLSASLKRKGIRCQIVVPLIVKDSGGERRLIGALYLNKYSDEPFSASEKFALEILASQAANTIHSQSFLSEKITWTEGNTDLAKAIEAIASRNDISLLLRDVANYSRSLVGASFSYLAFSKNDDDFEYIAASPEPVLAELQEFSTQKKYRDCKGITGLAAERKESILIADLQREKAQKSRYWESYIEFREGTRSELVVPIILKENKCERVLGVINLEHESPNAFAQVHQKIIEHFARQIAIAFQKKQLIESANQKAKMLSGLQHSMQKIIESPQQNMLNNAVLLTKEAVGAESVIVLPIKHKKRSEGEMIFEEIIPEELRQKDIIKALQEQSIKVFSEQDLTYIPSLSVPLKKDGFRDSNAVNSGGNFDVYSGLCLPFSSRNEKIGVMWIFFPEFYGRQLSEQDFKDNKAAYQVYANQIALAYSNAMQSENLKQKLSKQAFEMTSNIDQNYKDTRRQAYVGFLISVFASLSALSLVLFGVSTSLNRSQKTPSTLSVEGGIATVLGVVLQATTILAFKRGQEANERMDKYHRELYNVHQLEILLSAAEQLSPEFTVQVKQQIIQRATDSWLATALSTTSLPDSKSLPPRN